jgi:hypothetical protein
MPNPQSKAEMAQPRPRDPGGGNRRSVRIAQHTPSPPSETPTGTPAAHQQADQRQHASPLANTEQQKEDDEDTTASDIPGNISIALENAIRKHQMSDQLKKVLSNIQRYASKAMVKEGKKEIIQISIEDVRALREDLVADFSGIYSGLEAKIAKLTDTQERILKATDTITKEAEGLSAAAKEIENKVAKVTDVTDTIGSTTRTYRDAILSQPMQHNVALSELKLQDDIDRRAKQILVRVHSEDMKNKSLSDIKEKANQSIMSIEDDYERPDKVEVVSVSLTRNGAILLQMNSKQAATWLRDPATECKFAEEFANDTFFVGRTYNIIIPRAPITFNPSEEIQLREIEETNNMDSNSITKARWIKPANRRRNGQTHAYATLAISSPSIANQLIRNGITICGATSSPFKMKREPTQCMRCRGWGHFAAQCSSNNDTCGSCGGEHRTNNCDNPQKRHCTSCKASTHAAWDRNCPEFIRRCALYDEKFPENKLPFFPTDDNWTLTTRPDRVPSDSRFPKRYAVNSLPTRADAPNVHQKDQNPTKAKQQAKPIGKTKRIARIEETNSITRYFNRSQHEPGTSANAREESALPDPEYTSEPSSWADNGIVEHLLNGNTIPGSLSSWD